MNTSAPISTTSTSSGLPADTVVALVTGSSRGLGAALVAELTSRGAQVYAATRDDQDMTTAADRVVLDYTDPQSINATADHLRANVSRLDVLINCAGVNKAADAPPEASKGPLTKLDPTALHAMFAINVVGPTLATARLWPLLLESSSPRVINISTDRASLHNAVAANAFGYSVTKTALNMATRKIGAEIAEYGGAALAVHPGWLATRMGGFADDADDPLIAAANIIDLALSARAVTLNGAFTDRFGHPIPW